MRVGCRNRPQMLPHKPYKFAISAPQQLRNLANDAWNASDANPTLMKKEHNVESCCRSEAKTM